MCKTSQIRTVWENIILHGLCFGCGVCVQYTMFSENSVWVCMRVWAYILKILYFPCKTSVFATSGLPISTDRLSMLNINNLILDITSGWVLCPVLSRIMWTYCPAYGCVNKWMEHFSLGAAERAGTAWPREEKAHQNLISVFKYLMRENKEGSIPSDRQGVTGTN